MGLTYKKYEKDILKDRIDQLQKEMDENLKKKDLETYSNNYSKKQRIQFNNN